MTAPRLSRKLVLETAIRVPDGAGGYAIVWSAVGTLWANVIAGTGRERAGESATLSQVGYRIIVRAAPEGAPSRPRADQRFRDGSRVFAIAAIAEQADDDKYLTCFAIEENLS